jgi:hypothetical protein
MTARKLKALQQTAYELSTFGECIAIQSDLSTMVGVAALADGMLNRDLPINR